MLTQTYHIQGMHCNACANKVQTAISKLEHVESVHVSLELEQATVVMSEPLSEGKLNQAVKSAGSYTLTETLSVPPQKFISLTIPTQLNEEKKSLIKTYKPLLLVFAYLFGLTFIIEFVSGDFNLMRWMQNFMGGFFLVFSFFKLLDLNGIASSYSNYDVIAKRWLAYASIYPFLELTLGILFVARFNPTLTNLLTLVLMSLSSIGVIRSLLKKETIQCACLGSGFNLPMSTVALLEDGLMVAMSATMIILNEV